MNYSMRFKGLSSPIEVKVKPWPVPKYTPNVTWQQDSSGRWLPSSRTIAGDFWDIEVTLFAVKANMETFARWLDKEGRETFTVTAVDGVLFPPLIDQSAPFSACVVDVERILRVFWGGVNNGVDEVRFTLRAMSPAFIAVEPSLDSLCLQPEDERDASWSMSPAFLAGGGAVFMDRQDRAGRFRARFVQTEDEARAILKHLAHGDGRASAIPFPSIGVEYPFGPARGGMLKSCRVREWRITRESLGMWGFEIEFVEEV
jgi:hypothetical protein